MGLKVRETGFLSRDPLPNRRRSLARLRQSGAFALGGPPACSCGPLSAKVEIKRPSGVGALPTRNKRRSRTFTPPSLGMVAKAHCYAQVSQNF